jgi:hypothetical protein
MMEPTPEQFTAWLQEALKEGGEVKAGVVCANVARLAYAAGADAELGACCEWMEFQERLPRYLANDLRKARRPKPPGRKQLAMAELERFGTSETAAIRRAIESLPDD